MHFLESPLKGAFVVDLKRIEDSRGFFARAWCREEFAAHGLNPGATQLNVGYSAKRGTLRGLHYQDAPHEEAKFVRCTQGAVYDVIVDLRHDSATRGRWFGTELSALNRTMLYIPEGFAHGYQTVADDTEIYYLTSAPFVAKAAAGVRYDDPAFGIDWPLPVAVISDADRNWPDFRRQP